MLDSYESLCQQLSHYIYRLCIHRGGIIANKRSCIHAQNRYTDSVRSVTKTPKQYQS